MKKYRKEEFSYVAFEVLTAVVIDVAIFSDTGP
jgi:hypothetical protein